MVCAGAWDLTSKVEAFDVRCSEKFRSAYQRGDFLDNNTDDTLP